MYSNNAIIASQMHTAPRPPSANRSASARRGASYEYAVSGLSPGVNAPDSGPIMYGRSTGYSNATSTSISYSQFQQQVAQQQHQQQQHQQQRQQGTSHVSEYLRKLQQQQQQAAGEVSPNVASSRRHVSLPRGSLPPAPSSDTAIPTAASLNVLQPSARSNSIRGQSQYPPAPPTNVGPSGSKFSRRLPNFGSGSSTSSGSVVLSSTATGSNAALPSSPKPMSLRSPSVTPQHLRHGAPPCNPAGSSASLSSNADDFYPIKALGGSLVGGGSSGAFGALSSSPFDVRTLPSSGDCSSASQHHQTERFTVFPKDICSHPIEIQPMSSASSAEIPHDCIGAGGGPYLRSPSPALYANLSSSSRQAREHVTASISSGQMGVHYPGASSVPFGGGFSQSSGQFYIASSASVPTQNQRCSYQQQESDPTLLKQYQPHPLQQQQQQPCTGQASWSTGVNPGAPPLLGTSPSLPISAAMGSRATTPLPMPPRPPSSSLAALAKGQPTSNGIVMTSSSGSSSSGSPVTPMRSRAAPALSSGAPAVKGPSGRSSSTSVVSRQRTDSSDVSTLCSGVPDSVVRGLLKLSSKSTANSPGRSSTVSRRDPRACYSSKESAARLPYGALRDSFDSDTRSHRSIESRGSFDSNNARCSGSGSHMDLGSTQSSPRSYYDELASPQQRGAGQALGGGSLGAGTTGRSAVGYCNSPNGGNSVAVGGNVTRNESAIVNGRHSFIGSSNANGNGRGCQTPVTLYNPSAGTPGRAHVSGVTGGGGGGGLGNKAAAPMPFEGDGSKDEGPCSGGTGGRSQGTLPSWLYADLPLPPAGGSPGHGCCGLVNLGNTCFMNSVLQSLNAIPEWVGQFIIQSELKSSPSTMNARVTSSYRRLLQQINGGAFRTCVNPDRFLAAVAQNDNRWSGGRQQDGQEFLHALLEAFRSECSRLCEKPAYRELQGSGALHQQADEAEVYARSWHDSFVDDIFGGMLQSTIHCQSCGRESHCFEPFLDVSTPIPSSRGGPLGNAVSVSDCLAAFFEQECLDGANALPCERCKRERKDGRPQPHSKRMQVARYPRILVLTLKRFSQRERGGGGGLGFLSSFGKQGRGGASKNNSPVAIREHLKLATFCNMELLKPHRQPRAPDGSPMEPNYQLVAVSHHMGSLHGGHYTAQARSFRDESNGNKSFSNWYNFNDECVCPEPSAPDGPSSTAYLLFYRLKDLPPLARPRG